ncbi:MOSC domain-containing protein [Saccharospirillum impatiens]|uniref:MOSC domain-containing protein n=1 Tax=Saccharospirillum impatiens TaxID=169438 RepID=UPI00048F66F1|nr:MOSC N-terminal beta barrel domain-containing protein [Saccharospirillum impatiens]
MSYQVSVRELWVYPVKSLAGLRVEALQFDASGPVGDRRWMLVDERGRFVTQRSQMSMARYRLTELDGRIQIIAPSGRTLLLPEPQSLQLYPEITVTVWKDELTGYEVDRDASEWFSVELGMPVRLVWLGNASERRVSDARASDSERVGFADGYPLLVCNQASIDKLVDTTGIELEQRRFRPNVVVDGLPPDQELALGEWHFKEGTLVLLKVCERCNIPAIDPESGQYQKATAAQLKSACRFDGRTVFGVNAVARGVRSLRPGDTGRWVPL